MKMLATALVATLLAGCAIFKPNKAERDYSVLGAATGSNPGLIFTTADVRLILRRRNPVTHRMVTCTEPSPDVAAALSTVTQLAIQGGNKAANGQIGLTDGSAEAVTELAGRTTALLALRDGLYRTCEAYANGVLGAEAYALVLARYGQLMTTLFLGQDIASTASAGPQGAATSTTSTTSPALVNVALQGPGNTPAGNTSASSPSTPSQSPPASQNPTPQSPPNGASPSGPSTAPGATTSDPPSPTSSNPGTQSIPPQGSGSDNSSNAPSTPAGGAQDTPPSGASIEAASLARMNEDYFDLDQNPIQLLMVACINDYDTTDLAASRQDPWLRKICNHLDSLKRIAGADKRAAEVDLMVKHPAPAIDLAQIGLTQVKTDSSTSTAPSAYSATLVPRTSKSNQIRLVQLVLRVEGYRISGVTGLLDRHTVDAIEHYERNNDLPVSAILTPTLLQHIAGDMKDALNGVAR
jgi:hypothetical protein